MGWGEEALAAYFVGLFLVAALVVGIIAFTLGAWIF